LITEKFSNLKNVRFVAINHNEKNASLITEKTKHVFLEIKAKSQKVNIICPSFSPNEKNIIIKAETLKSGRKFMKTDNGVELRYFLSFFLFNNENKSLKNKV